MNELLARAVRLVVTTNTRYPGITPHHWTCATERGPGLTCDCGADDLTEALRLLALAAKRVGEPLWHATDDELKSEFDALGTLDSSVDP